MSNNPTHVIAVTCVIEKDGKFLIVQRKDAESEHGGKWLFPGGKVELGENPIQTLYREIKEEVNIRVRDEIAVIRLYEFPRNDGDHGVGIVFVAKYLSGNVRLDDDLLDYKWINPDEFSSFDVIPGSDTHLRNAQIAIERGILVDKKLLAENC